MRRLVLIAAIVAVAGCAGHERLPTLPKVVRVPVEKIVPVPAELARDCEVITKREDTYAEAIRLANARAASIAECNKRLAQIRALGAKP